MKNQVRITALVLLTIMLLLCIHSCATNDVIIPARTGHWEGAARIIVSWCHQTNLRVVVDIHADGSVTGKIGDATLVDGHFLSHRTWPWGHSMITGKFEGDIVAAENITRKQLKMICDFKDGSYTGQIDTEGALCVFSSEKTRKEKMALTAIGLKLAQPKPNL